MFRSETGERVVVVVNLSATFLGKEKTKHFIFYSNYSLFLIAYYRVPNMPVDGWWHEWTFNYDVKVENNEVHLDLAEREAKILVWLGESWQPPTVESPPEPSVESLSINDPDTKSGQNAQ